MYSLQTVTEAVVTKYGPAARDTVAFFCRKISAVQLGVPKQLDLQACAKFVKSSVVSC